MQYLIGFIFCTLFLLHNSAAQTLSKPLSDSHIKSPNGLTSMQRKINETAGKAAELTASLRTIAQETENAKEVVRKYAAIEETRLALVKQLMRWPRFVRLIVRL
jgi:hypothetical protein